MPLESRIWAKVHWQGGKFSSPATAPIVPRQPERNSVPAGAETTMAGDLLRATRRLTNVQPQHHETLSL